MNASIFRLLPMTALIASMPVAAMAADTYKLDPQHTQTIFSVSHLGYSMISGNFHDISGTIVFDEQRPQNSRVDVTIATTSIDTGLAPRDAHLRTAEFFDVEKYPTMTFKSTKVTKTGDGMADVLGDLTLRGITKQVVLKVKYNRCAPDQMRANAMIAGFTATTAIKRSDFGMKAYLPYLGDDVAITINTEAVKQ